MWQCPSFPPKLKLWLIMLSVFAIFSVQYRSGPETHSWFLSVVWGLLKSIHVRILIQNSGIFMQFLCSWGDQTESGGWMIPTGLSMGKSGFHSRGVTSLHWPSVFTAQIPNTVTGAGLKSTLLYMKAKKLFSWYMCWSLCIVVFLGEEQTRSGGGNRELRRAVKGG